MSEPTCDQYDPLDPAVAADPYPYFTAMRREGVVYREFPFPVYVATRYDHVQEILHNPGRFSSTLLQLMFTGGVAYGPNAAALAGHRMFDAPMMIAVDPPDHARLRGLVNRGFTPRRIAALEPRVRELAVGYLEQALEAGGGEMELIHDFAVPLPVTVIAELLGVEPERRREFKRWSDAVVIGLPDQTGTWTPAEIRSAVDELCAHIEEIADRRRREPRDDLLSVLVAAEEGEALSTEEVLSFVFLLLVAGNETTTNLIGNAMNALLRHPEALAEVQDDPGLIPGMLEETLRYDSPIQSLPRVAVEDTSLGGREIPRGSFVMPLFGAANRDERRFPDPDRFDIHRSTQGHLAFGHGVHFCLGAALARLEARVAFEELLARCRSLRLAARDVEMLASPALRGPRALPIRFDVVGA